MSASDGQFDLTLPPLVMRIELYQILPSNQLIDIALRFAELVDIHLPSSWNDSMVSIDFFVVPGFTHQVGIRGLNSIGQGFAVVLDGVQHIAAILEMLLGQVS